MAPETATVTRRPRANVVANRVESARGDAPDRRAGRAP